MLNEAYSRVEYRLDREGFDSIPALIRYYVGNRKPVSQVGLVTIFLLINLASKFYFILLLFWLVVFLIIAHKRKTFGS